MEKLKNIVCNNSIDLLSLTEVNRDWRTVPTKHTIWEGTKGWKEHRRIQTSSNTNQYSDSNFLVGGTAMCMFNDLTFCITEQGQDVRKLGRWSFFTVTGKNNLKTTFITCYCPVRGNNPGSVYTQHLTYIAQNRDDLPEYITCPRQLFGFDLGNLLTSMNAKGNQLIIMGDFNSSYKELNNWMLNYGLTDIIASRHGKCPTTYNRSKSEPLDVVFASPHILSQRSGYLSFGRLSGDHRGIWLDIPKLLILGYNPPQPTHPLARRLKLSDPRVVERYLSHLYEGCMNEGLFQRMNYIHTTMTDPLSQALITEYEYIDEKLCNLMDEAESKCRKFHTGSYSWSPQLQRSALRLDYWLQRRSYSKGSHRNIKALVTL